VSRPAVLVVAGLWLGLLFASWAIASATFRTVDRVLAEGRPEVVDRLAGIPEADRRLVLRHVASEVNRWMFGGWAVAQVALGAVAVALTWRAGGAAPWLAAAALAVVLGQALGLGPAIRDLGRAVDFTPRPLPSPLAGRFGMLHGAYVLLDFAKAALVAALAWLVARS
jgi:hypothetical protein